MWRGKIFLSLKQPSIKIGNEAFAWALACLVSSSTNLQIRFPTNVSHESGF